MTIKLITIQDDNDKTIFKGQYIKYKSFKIDNELKDLIDDFIEYHNRHKNDNMIRILKTPSQKYKDYTIEIEYY
jgi:hypothetical protein